MSEEKQDPLQRAKRMKIYLGAFIGAHAGCTVVQIIDNSAYGAAYWAVMTVLAICALREATQ